MKSKKTYTLDEICARLDEAETLDVVNSRKNENAYNRANNAWCEALLAMEDMPHIHKEALAMHGLEWPESDSDEAFWMNPGELDAEYRMIARRDKFRFYEDGKVASYDLYHK